MAANIPILTDAQLAAFDAEFVDDTRWQRFRECADTAFPDGRFSMLDIGGGTGRFADRVLDYYPRAAVTVLDLSPMLLGKNRPHDRKTTVLGSALDVSGIDSRFDVVCFNWVLHHLVGNSYAECITNIRTALRSARSLLRENGRISIYENLCDGWIVDRAPSRIIYALTTAKAIAPIVRANGGNTAGTGVCFQSERRWRRNFDAAWLLVDSAHRYANPLRCEFWRRMLFRIALHLRTEHVIHFWLRDQTNAPRTSVP